MDADISRALGELERKLQELQRTLSSIGGGDLPGEEPAWQSSQEPAWQSSEEPVWQSSGEPAWRSARETPVTALSTRAAIARPHAEPPSRRRAAGGGTRLVDEAFERRTADFPRVSEPYAHGQNHALQGVEPRAWRSAEPARARVGGAPAIGARLSTDVPASPPQTTAAELAGFRDRLAQRDPELAEDYQALLGRLSYPAVPTSPPAPSSPPAPTPNSGALISFARGAPSLDIVDVQGLREAAMRAFDSDPQGTTAYGTSVGYQRLRTWIADRHGVEPERVIVTNGSMQADEFLFEHLVHPADEVIVERPTYDRTLLSLRQRGARVQAIELEADGIDTDELADLLEGGARPTLAHIIPNFQNPAGHTLSLRKREALLELAAEYDFTVFEDDPYVALRFSGESLPTMLSMDPERVVYASSFSKTVCPGIRVGYLVGPTDVIAAVAQLATGAYISPNMVAQSIVYEFCASGSIDRSIDTVRNALAERAATLANALRRDLPDAEFSTPEGGYFMWVTLPEGTDVAALHAAAADAGVAFVKGTDFLLSGGENTLRLAYSGVTPRQIEEGVARLADAYRSL
jgi:DNA-binding transcriptional MocR family regulator